MAPLTLSSIKLLTLQQLAVTYNIQFPGMPYVLLKSDTKSLKKVQIHKDNNTRKAI